MSEDLNASRGSQDRPALDVGPPPHAIPEGWTRLDDLPPEGADIEGLLTNGRIVDAEWWGPVPEELWGPNGEDGSGWAWNGTDQLDFGARLGLLAWRLRDGMGRAPSPPQTASQVPGTDKAPSPNDQGEA